MATILQSHMYLMFQTAFHRHGMVNIRKVSCKQQDDDDSNDVCAVHVRCGLRAERRASRPDAESVHCAACAGGRGGGCSLADAVCHRCPLSALRGSRSGDGCMDGCARRVARGPWGVGVHTRSRPQRRRAAHPCPVPRPPVLAPTPAGGAYRMVCIRSVYEYVQLYRSARLV